MQQICRDCGATWEQVSVLSKVGTFFDVALGGFLICLGLAIGGVIHDNYRWWGLVLVAWGMAIIIHREPWKKKRLISPRCPSCRSDKTVDVTSPLGQEVLAHWKARKSEPPKQELSAEMAKIQELEVAKDELLATLRAEAAKERAASKPAKS